MCEYAQGSVCHAGGSVCESMSKGVCVKQKKKKVCRGLEMAFLRNHWPSVQLEDIRD